MPYYTPGTTFTAATLARSQAVNSEFQAVADSFATLPDAEKLVSGTATFALDTGSTNAYVVALSPVPASYSTGLTVDFKALNANTGPSTINVSGLGAKTIRAYDGSELSAGQIPGGAIVTVRFDGTVFRLNNIVGFSVPPDDSVTNAKLANMAPATIKGRPSGGSTGDPDDLTPAEVRTILDLSNPAYAFRRDNILAPVAQSGGVPTGGAIERGSNSNGDFVRFADGTQICTIRGATFTYDSAAQLVFTWTFPKAFSTVPNIMPALSSSGASYVGMDATDIGCFRHNDGTSSSQCLLTRVTGAPVFVSGDRVADARLTAIGRWF